MRGFYQKLVKIEEMGAKSLNIQTGMYMVLRKNEEKPISLSENGQNRTKCQVFSFVGPIPEEYFKDNLWVMLDAGEEQIVQLTEEWKLMYTDETDETERKD